MIRVARWSARVLSTGLVLLVVALAAGQGIPAIWKQPIGVRLEFLGLSLMLAGGIVGWKRDGLAGLLLLAGYAFFPIVELISNGRYRLLEGRCSPFELALLSGVLFCICWWHERNHRVSLQG